MAIIKDAIKDMESMMKPEIVKKANRQAKIELFFIRLKDHIKFGSYEDHFDITPCLNIYLHSHNYSDEDNKLWHFHISVQWIKWYFELQFGKDYVDN